MLLAGPLVAFGWSRWREYLVTKGALPTKNIPKLQLPAKAANSSSIMLQHIQALSEDELNVLESAENKNSVESKELQRLADGLNIDDLPQ